MVARLADVWARVTDLDVVGGQGSWVVADDGTRYLDLTAGIAVTSTGHCHPDVVAAIREQAGRFIHAQLNVYRHDLLNPLVAALDAVTPAILDTFFLTNSGAEAVEAAVKLAKQATGRSDIIVFRGGFHGRTHLAMAMTTAKAVYRVGARPLPDGIAVAPYPDMADSGASAKLAIAELLMTEVHPRDVAAIVIEPVLGEGGYRSAPPAFLRHLREVADRIGAALVFDEVQTGIGRTGRMFALEHSGVTPDVLVIAKGLGSGFPIAAIATSAHLAERWVPGSHGGTYGGNPIGCAAALATLRIVGAPGFLEEVARKGEVLLTGLRDLGRHGVVDVRGLGLMVALQFVDAETCAAVRAHLLGRSHIITMSAGPAGDVLRLMPPLTISDGEIDLAVMAIRSAVEVSR